MTEYRNAEQIYSQRSKYYAQLTPEAALELRKNELTLISHLHKPQAGEMSEAAFSMLATVVTWELTRIKNYMTNWSFKSLDLIKDKNLRELVTVVQTKLSHVKYLDEPTSYTMQLVKFINNNAIDDNVAIYVTHLLIAGQENDVTPNK